MTERTPRDAFDEIVGNLKNDMLDPVIEPLFRRVHEYVAQLDGERITKKEAAMIRDELNHMLYDIDPDARDIFVRVSGKARLLSGADLNILTDSRYTSHLHALQPGVTERFDEDGSYYPLHRQLAALDYIAVEPDGEWNEGVALHRISYRLTLSSLDYDEYAEYAQDEGEEDYNDDEYDEDGERIDNDQVDIIIYGSDLSSLERADASQEQIARDVRRYFPEVAAQLDAIPNDSYDEMDAVRAIKDLDLVFDWSKSPYHDADERQAVIDVISNILVEKLGLDSSMYQLTYQGLVGGIQPDGSHIRQVQSERRTLNGIIVGTMLEEINDPDADPEVDVSEYYVGVFISAPAYGRDRGDMLITMPLASIMGLVNLRNDPVFASPSATHPTMATPQAMEFLANGESAVAETEVPARSEPQTPGNIQPRLPQSELERYQNDFDEFWRTMRTYSDKVYTSVEDVTRTQQYLLAAMEDFAARHPEIRGRRMSFTGECVEYIETNEPGTLTVERSPLRLELAENIIHRGDMMTTRTGWFMGAMSVVVESNYDESNPEFKVHPYLFIVENGLRGAIGSAPEGAIFGAALYQMRYESMIRFAVDLTREGFVELTELTQTRHFNESIARLAESVPDKVQLPAYLADVMHDLESEVPDKLIAIGAESLRAIGEEVQGNRTARLLTTEVLAGIFGQRNVVLQGKIYDAEGEEKASELRGKLLTVVDTAPTGKLSGPMFVLLQGNDLRYAPVAEVTSMQI